MDHSFNIASETKKGESEGEERGVEERITEGASGSRSSTPRVIIEREDERERERERKKRKQKLLEKKRVERRDRSGSTDDREKMDTEQEISGTEGDAEVSVGVGDMEVAVEPEKKRKRKSGMLKKGNGDGSGKRGGGEREEEREREKEREKERVGEQILRDRLKEVCVTMWGVVSREENKISKAVGAQIQRGVLEFQDILSDLLAENRALKAAMQEKELACQRLVRQAELLGGDQRRVDQRGGEGQRKEEEGRERELMKDQGSERRAEERTGRSYAVVVRGKGTKEAKVVEDRLREAEKGMGLKVQSVRATKEGKVVLELATAEDKMRVMEEHALKVAGLRVEEPRRFPPLMIIRGVPKGMKDEQILSEVFTRNLRGKVDEKEYKAKVRVKRRTMGRTRDKEGIILEVTGRIKEALIGMEREGRVFVEWGVCFAEVWEQIPRCFGCYGFAHRVADCKKRLCSRCCKGGHLVKDCREKEATCGNCRAKGLNDRHGVWSEACPELRWRLQRWRERVQE